MDDATVRAILVDALAAYLSTGKSAAQISHDLRVPAPADQLLDSEHRAKLRRLFGGFENEVRSFLDSLVGSTSSAGGVLTKTHVASGDQYSVV